MNTVKIPKKTVTKPARVKESRVAYSVRTKAPTRARQTDFEFHICLPAGVNAEEFTDKLIELVESVKGTVGGGVVTTEA